MNAENECRVKEWVTPGVTEDEALSAHVIFFAWLRLDKKGNDAQYL